MPESGAGQVVFFAGRLRELRQAAGLSRRELAAKAGMRGPNGIRDLEQGVRSPAWGTVLALAKALGVTLEAFVQPPAERAPAGPGRPAKGKAEARRKKK
jgi:transcriptional regulator with XRE-family HTH domain